MKILCVIPARYASTRLPGKPLALIGNKTMIERVYERACKAQMPDKVLVATDHETVAATVVAFGGDAVMTLSSHPTGTDRLAEVAGKMPEYELIINVQGDEPLIEPAVIDSLAEAFRHEPNLQMATLATVMDDEEYKNPNVVKVVVDKQDYALYFSRSHIPYPRVAAGQPVYKHIGIYAYKRDFLLKYAKLESSPLEKTESLEQLRALEYGYRIKVVQTNFQSVGVDTPEDLQKVCDIINALEEKECKK